MKRFQTNHPSVRLSLLAASLCVSSVHAQEASRTVQKTGEAAAKETVLPGVDVVGRVDPPPAFAGGQVASATNLGVLGARSVMDTPFNATGYTAEYMDNIQARTLQDVLGADPTVRFQYPQGALVESMYIRGSTYNVNNSSLNGMPGMAPAFSIPTEILERIEVLRGPGAFLDGLNIGSEPNGGVNAVLKHALPTDLTRLMADHVSEGQFGAQIDASRRLGADRQFGIRFNGAVRDGNTAVDGQDAGRTLGSLALDYTNERLRINLDAYQLRNKFDGAGTFVVQAVNRAAANVVVPRPAPDYDASIRGLYAREDSKAVLLQGEFRFSQIFSGYARAGRAETEASGFYGGGTILNPNAAGIGTLSLSNSNVKLEKDSYQAGLRAGFATGPLTHQAVLGWSRLDLSQFQLNGTVPGSSANITNVSIYNPVFDTARVPQVKPGAPKLQEQSLSSFVLADTLSWREGLLQFTAGARRQSVEMRTFNQTTGAVATRYDESVVTPLFALVVKPLQTRDTLAIYYSYIEGLQRGPTAPVNATFVNSGEVFAPYETKQSELGVKWNTGTFVNTLSFYELERPSFIPRALGNNTFLFTDDGLQRNRGAEWMVFGELSGATRLLGGVSYTKTKLVTTNGGVNQGNEVGGFPDWQGNLGVEWDTSFLPRLTLSSRVNFNGKMYVNSTDSQKLPTWTTFAVGARYRVESGDFFRDRPLNLRFNVDNVLDRQGFWAGARTDGVFYVAPGRVFKLSAALDF